MIGDSWQHDILGAKKAGIDQIFYNPLEKPREGEETPTHEIKDLREIYERIILRD